ncbi:MAG: PAS domain-containing protein [Verrucomicrobiales bacterium]|nr:PAS domain-containing protein [Verrucomicrobiales bacterium]
MARKVVSRRNGGTRTGRGTGGRTTLPSGSSGLRLGNASFDPGGGDGSPGDELLQAVWETAPVAFCLTDARGQCVRTNAEWQRLSGLTDAESRGDGWVRCIHPEDIAGVLSQWGRAKRAGRVFVADFRILRPDGSVRWVRARASAIRNPSGKLIGYFGIDEDVTERRYDDEFRRMVLGVASELATASTLSEALPRLLEILAGGLGAALGEFWERDSLTDTLRVAHVWFSPSSRKLAGFVRHSEQLAIPLFDGMPGRVMSTGKPEWISDLGRNPNFFRRRAAVRAGLKSALAMPVSFHGRVIGVMAFLGHRSDPPDAEWMRLLHTLAGQISQFMECQHTSEALVRSEASLRRAQSLAHLGSYQTDLTLRGSTRWSGEVFYILGLNPRESHLSQEEFLSRIVHPADRLRVADAVTSAARRRQAFDLQFRIVRPDGTVRHVQNAGEPVLDGKRRLQGWVGTLWDVTERKELERGILEASEREQRRLGQDLHDGLGQRLTALELFSESLAADLRTAAPHLSESARQMSRELRKTLVQTRLLSHGLSPVPLEADGLMRALRELAAGIRSMARVRCEFEAPRSVALGDSTVTTHLYRIAQEAVNNALKHSGATRIRIRLNRGRRGLELEVGDDGRGLADSKRPEDGIGIRVMQFRAELIGASLELSSKPGRGTVVRCILRKLP